MKRKIKAEIIQVENFQTKSKNVSKPEFDPRTSGLNCKCSTNLTTCTNLANIIHSDKDFVIIIWSVTRDSSIESTTGQQTMDNVISLHYFNSIVGKKNHKINNGV